MKSCAWWGVPLRNVSFHWLDLPPHTVWLLIERVEGRGWGSGGGGVVVRWGGCLFMLIVPSWQWGEVSRPCLTATWPPPDPGASKHLQCRCFAAPAARKA